LVQNKQTAVDWYRINKLAVDWYRLNKLLLIGKE